VWLRDRNTALLLSEYRSVASILEFNMQKRHKYTQNCCSRTRRFNNASKKTHHLPWFDPVPSTSLYCSCFIHRNVMILTVQFTNWHLFNSVFSEALARLRKASTTFVMSVRLFAWNNSATAEWIFMKFGIWIFFEKSVKKIKVVLKSEKNNRHFI
jgi:pheromone shutdown protein TraB